MLNHSVKVLYHSSIMIGENIFIDPYKINGEYDAKYIFITHSHYDHYSVEDIKKIVKEDTIFIVPIDVSNELKKQYNNKIISIYPNQEIKINDLLIKTLPSYNVNKQFHKKEYNWVGYLIKYQDITYAILGDCDINEDNKKVKCDCLILPIGGTYTMNGEEGATLANIIRPKLVIPVHYNSIVGSKRDEEQFINNLNKNIKYEIQIK